MSYILDALKKKETESADTVPDLSSQHYHSEFEEDSANKKYFLIVLGILLLAGLIYLAYYLGQNKDISTEKNAISNDEVISSQVSNAESTIEEVQTEQVAEVNASTKPAAELQVTAKPIAINKPVVEKVQLPVTQPAKSPVAAVTEPEVVNIEQVETDTVSENQAEVSQNFDVNRSDDFSALPALRYSSHVYADNPKSRFVMLNGKALGIGQRLPNGVKVEDIYEDDLLVSYKGKTYKIPSLTDIE